MTEISISVFWVTNKFPSIVWIQTSYFEILNPRHYDSPVQVFHCDVLSPDVHTYVTCPIFPLNLDSATRRSDRPSTTLGGTKKREEKGRERERESRGAFRASSCSRLVQNGFCCVCVQSDGGNVGGWWIDGHRVSRANVKRASMPLKLHRHNYCKSAPFPATPRTAYICRCGTKRCPKFQIGSRFQSFSYESSWERWLIYYRTGGWEVGVCRKWISVQSYGQFDQSCKFLILILLDVRRMSNSELYVI